MSGSARLGSGRQSVEELQEEIRRLNAALARRQNNEAMAQYLDSEGGLLSEYAQTVPPLFIEYEALLHEYEKERERVHELSRALEQFANDKGLVDSSAIEDNLQSQLAQALLEKDQSFELYQRAQLEVDRLADQVAALKSGAGLEQLETMHSAHASQLESEINRLRADAAAMREENAHLVKTNRQLRDELGSVSIGPGGANAGELRRLRDELASAEERMAQNQERSNSDRQTLESRILELQDRLTEAEVGVGQATEQVRDAVATAETAVQEKNEVLIESSQRKSECERLQAALNQLVEDAGARTREEVAAVRSEANERIEALTEEVSQAEQALAEARVEMERALKDKRLVEGELDRVSREALLRSSTESATKEDMQRRLLTAERERDSLQLRLDTLSQERKREEFGWRSERSQLLSELSSVKEQLASVSASLERSQADRDAALLRAEEAETKCNAAKRECQLAERRLKVQFDQAEQEAQMKLAEIEIRRTAESDTYRATVSSLRGLLVAQQRLAQRWKEEANGLAERMERLHEDKRSETLRLQQRSDELSQLLRNCRRQLEEAEAALKERDRAVRRLEERVGSIRQKGASSSAKLRRSAQPATDVNDS